MAKAQVPSCDICGMYDQQARLDEGGKVVGVVQIAPVRVEAGDRRYVGLLCEVDALSVFALLDTLPAGSGRRKRRSAADMFVADPADIPRVTKRARKKPPAGP